MHQASEEFVSNLDTVPLVVRLTFADGRVIPADMSDLSADPITSVTFTGGNSNGNAATIGCAVSAGAEIVLERSLLDSAAFGTQQLHIDVGMLLDGEYEWIPMGVYRIANLKKTDGTVTLQCADDIGTVLERPYEVLADFDFESGVDGKLFLSALCARRGVTVDLSGLPDVTLTIADPTDMTERQIVAALAGLWGKFACIDRMGTLRFLWYGHVDAQIGPDDYYDGECICGEPFAPGYLKCYNTTLAETLIAGDASGQQGMYFECPWCDQEQLEALWADLQDFGYSSVERVRLIGNPLLDPWDVITLTDAVGAAYDVPILAIYHEYDGGLITEISASAQTNTETQTGPVERDVKRSFAQIIKRQKTIELTVSEQNKKVIAQLELCVKDTENSKIVSMINAAADKISLRGNRVSIVSDNFTLTEDGRITATAGTIGGCQIVDGKLQVPVANITGTIYANALAVYDSKGRMLLSAGDNAVTLSGWTAASNGLYKSSDDGQIRLIPNGGLSSAYTVNGHSTTDWVFLCGPDNSKVCNFGVDKSGHLYAAGAHISGTADITGGSINIISDGETNSRIALSYNLYRSSMSPNGIFVASYVDDSFSEMSRYVAMYNYAVRVVNGSAWAALGTAGVTTSSDRRLKDNIKYFSDDKYLNFVRALKPCSFTYKGAEELSFGLIAQDVKASMDDLDINFQGYAPPQEGNEYASLNYSAFIGPIIYALQRALARIDQLEERIKEVV